MRMPNYFHAPLPLMQAKLCCARMLILRRAGLRRMLFSERLQNLQGQEDVISMNLTALARKIIKTNYYMTISTTDGTSPWISPVFFWNDKNYNFYFVSYTKSKHAKNILKNRKVAAAIFDSHQKITKPKKGVQGKGICTKVKGVVEVTKGLFLWHKAKLVLSCSRARSNCSFSIIFGTGIIIQSCSGLIFRLLFITFLYFSFFHLSFNICS